MTAGGRKISLFLLIDYIFINPPEPPADHKTSERVVATISSAKLGTFEASHGAPNGKVPEFLMVFAYWYSVSKLARNTIRKFGQFSTYIASLTPAQSLTPPLYGCPEHTRTLRFDK
jgi:hypothetical protein